MAAPNRAAPNRAAPNRSGRPSLLLSPNSVLANALLRTIDLLRPRVHAARPTRIEFVVGTQINGAPHLGTNLVQTAAFLLAKTARREFSIDTVVRFGAPDNAPHKVVLDPETYHAYQQTYHEMGIYKRYFDLMATGCKTTEIRVNDPSRKKIKEGSLIRFRCQGDQVLTRVTRIVRYTSFDEMFDHESVTSVNPLATRDQQLANIRQIYPPEREALGVLAIGIELIDLPPI